MITLGNLLSVEFVFENGDGALVDSDDFIMFGVKDNGLKFAIKEKCNKHYYDEYTGWNVLFERILCNNIAQIIVKDKYLETETFFIDWSDGHDFINANQNTYINEFGNLVCTTLLC